MDVSRSTWQDCFTYYQKESCQAVPDKAIITSQQKYACQVVLDKIVFGSRDK